MAALNPTRRIRAGTRFLIISVLVTCTLTLAGGLLARRNYADQQDRIVSDIQEHAISVADDTDRFFSDRILLLRTITQFPALRSGNPRAIQNILNEIETSRVGFTGGLGWADAQGLLQASGTPISQPPIDLSDRDYVRAALDRDTPFVGQINIGRVIPGPVVGISAPTHAQSGETHGVLIGTLRLDRLDPNNRDLPIRDSEVVVVDRANRIVIREGVIPSSIETISSGLLDEARLGSPRVQVGITDFDGNADRIVASAAVPTSDWVVLISLPASAAFSLARNQFFNEIGVLMLVSLTAVTAMALIARRLDLVAEEEERATAELQASEERFRALANSVPPFIWVANKDGAISYASDRWRAYSGETQGSDLSSPMDAIVHPTDRIRYEAEWARAVENGSELECEVRLRRHDGSYRWFLTQATPVHSRDQHVISWFGSSTDIHERKLLEQELEHNRLLLEESQLSAHVGSWAWDIVQDSLSWSDELYRLYGVEPDSAVLNVTSFMEFVHPDDRTRVQEHIQAALRSGEPFRFEHRIVRPDGEVRTLEARGRAVQDEIGDVVGMIGSGQDVSERKRLEQLQQEFIAMAAHELKTPITALRGYAQLLQRGRDSGRALEMIVEQSRHLARLVDDLLEASHLDAGRLDLRRTSIDLVTLVGRCVDDAQALSDSHQIVLQTSASEIIGHWDPDRIEQILQNLLSNAIKYSPAGERVVVKLEETDEQAIIRVQDNGLGIAPDLIPHIFDRFYRVQESAVSTKGLGLGLYITRSFVEAHGGSIEVESGSTRSGTTFSIVLPRQQRETANGETQAEHSVTV